jgi:hypothetical protein
MILVVVLYQNISTSIFSMINAYYLQSLNTAQVFLRDIAQRSNLCFVTTYEISLESPRTLDLYMWIVHSIAKTNFVFVPPHTHL